MLPADPNTRYTHLHQFASGAVDQLCLAEGCEVSLSKLQADWYAEMTGYRVRPEVPHPVLVGGSPDAFEWKATVLALIIMIGGGVFLGGLIGFIVGFIVLALTS